MDFQVYITPWNIAGAIGGLVLSVALVIALVLGRKKVGAWLKATSDKMFSQMGFFSIVILVFMAISVLESGDFFNANITHGAFFGLLGSALALGFDLVSVVCMQARLNATRMHDERGKLLNLIGVSICASVSAFANACGSLQGYSAANLSNTPGWMQAVAPWLGMVFPAMIIVLSMTTDHIIDHSAPAKGIDLDTYRSQEKKRVDMLQVRLDTEKDMLKLEAELSTLRRGHNDARGHVQREWFFMKWLRPQTTPTLDTIKAQMDEAIKVAREALEQHVGQVAGQLLTLSTQVNQQMSDLSRVNIENMSNLSTLINQQISDLSRVNTENLSTLRGQLDTRLDTLGNQMSDRLSTLDTQMDTLAGQLDQQGVHLETLTGRIDDQRTNLDTLGNAVAGQFKTIRGQINSMTGNRPVSNGHQRTEQREGDTGETESVALGQRILAAFQQQGITTFHRQIANQLGCSPTTVGSWKAKFQREGLLPPDPVPNATQHPELVESIKEKEHEHV